MTLSRSACAVLAVCGVALAVTGLAALARPASATSSERVLLAEQRVATIDMFGLIERMIQSERYLPAREANNNALRAKLDGVQKELEAMQTSLQGADQAGATFQAEVQKFQQKYQEFQMAQGEAQGEADRFNTAQLVEAFRLITDTADAIAAQKGYTHVMATRPKSVDIRAENLAGALQELIARPVLRAPESDDITTAVAETLSLPPAPAPAASTPASGAAEPAPITAPASEPAPAAAPK